MVLGRQPLQTALRFWKNGKQAYAQFLEEMQHARHQIHMEFFIFRDDQAGQEFKKVLIAKAKQGVEVRLIYDAVGSFYTAPAFFRELTANGVHVVSFHPPFTSLLEGRINNRLHRKLVVIDGQIAFIGGENIGDEYLGKNKKYGFWRDTGIMVKGNAVNAIQQIFLSDWYLATGQKIIDQAYFTALPVADGLRVRVIIGGPDAQAENIAEVYKTLFRSARKRIFISTPYFTPNRALLDSLYRAAERGVQVNLLVPTKADYWLSQYSNQYYINKLLQHGINVSLYRRGFLHSKVVIIDDHLVSVGTANVNQRSAEDDYEVNCLIDDAGVNSRLAKAFAGDLTHSTKLNAVTYRQRDWLSKLKEQIARLFTMLL